MDYQATQRHCRSSLDMISNLPSNIIENILMFLPVRDMARTSVLSRSWRSCWVTLPQLVFEGDLRVSRRHGDSSLDNMLIVFGILLLHQGSILKFKLDMFHWGWCCCSDINKIIPLLSKKGIEDLTFRTNGLHCQHNQCDKLPSSILSCVELKHLSLTHCVFQPLTLVGFKKLISIELINIEVDLNVVIPCGPLLETMKLETSSHIDSFSVDAPNLKSLWLNGDVSYFGLKTPLLKVLSLKGQAQAFDLNTLLHSMPLLENMCLSGPFHKFLVLGDSLSSPNELPIVLNNLRILELCGFDVKDMRQLSSTLLWIRNQPNLQKLVFAEVWPYFWAKSGLNFQELHYSEYSLVKLRELEFDFIRCMEPCIDFMKFLLTVSPELETLSIMPPFGEETLDNAKILFGLACSRRASSKAEIICFDIDWNML